MAEKKKAEIKDEILEEKKEENVDNKKPIEKEDDQEEVEVTLEDLIKESEKLKEENKKYYEHLQRTAAEFDNYKKRVTKEKESIYSLAVGDVVLKYIPILDNLEKAMNIEGLDQKIKEGLELIHRQVLETMGSFNVIEIPTVGEKFSPEIHDAVMHVENKDFGEKVVIEELRKGYKMGERIIRHAMVKVAN
jgi:molecular chaperone GrpE